MSLCGNDDVHPGNLIPESGGSYPQGLLEEVNEPRLTIVSFARCSLLACKKRSSDEGLFSTVSAKRRALAKIEFLPGTFRALVIIDDGDGYPVIPRNRSGKRGSDPMVIEDESPPAEPQSDGRGEVLRSAEKRPGIAPAIAPEGSSHWTDDPDSATTAALDIEPKVSSTLLRIDHDGVDQSSPPADPPQDVLEDPNPQGMHPFESPLIDDGEPPRYRSLSAFVHVERAMQRSARPAKDNMSCEDRKRLLVHTPPHGVLRSMRGWVAGLFSQLDPSLGPAECWLHPSPPLPYRSGRQRGGVYTMFSWKDNRGKHQLNVNFGVAALLLKGLMTDVQKNGFIKERWHLSHLCGNWVCLNPSHFTVEPGPVDIGRNCCFTHRNGCAHLPKCMKDKKRKPLTSVLASLYGLEQPLVTKQFQTGRVDCHFEKSSGIAVTEPEGFSSQEDESTRKAVEPRDFVLEDDVAANGSDIPQYS
ncbi:MAG: hypothetical protein M1812_005448 [Candelaria pacifica]|nr:MAG: hypothetical protein M1812_005448 [Candelaria pacifica]